MDSGARRSTVHVVVESDMTERLNNMHGKMQESGATEIIPLICTSAI